MTPPAAALNMPAGVDLDRFRLRNFLDTLARTSELDIRPDPIPLHEIGAVLEGNSKAVLFAQAGAGKSPLVGNVMGSRARMAHAFGVDPKDVRAEILRRLANKPKLIEIPRSAAPAQQVVLQGANADLTKLPVHLQHGRDGGPYISGAIDFSFDPVAKRTNVGLRRLMLRGRHETSIDLVAPNDLRILYLASLKRSERYPLSIVVGAHPIDYFAGAMRGVRDELGLISSLRDAPLPVVKSITNDLLIPADAEWVIEGYLDDQGYREPEGPYGEVLGYYGGVKINPVFHVTAITHRHDAVFQTVSISGRTMGRTDSAQLIALRTEVLLWRALEGAIKEPVAVYAVPASGGCLNVRVALRQRAHGDARNAIAAVFCSLANCKHVSVVDPDVDIFSDEQMEWALATRFQADRDFVVGQGLRSTVLDPSLGSAKAGAKAGFDLTVPMETTGFELSVPEAPSYKGKRFPSIRAALEDGPKFFEELMAALASKDEMDVVVALEQLRDAGKLGRDLADGRYQLVARKP
jgi:2,5-furandicarboxylate decarboxylase 1